MKFYKLCPNHILQRSTYNFSIDKTNAIRFDSNVSVDFGTLAIMSLPFVIIPVAVGKLNESYGENFRVFVNQFSAKENEWSHEFSFKALKFPQPNTSPVNII